MAESSHITEVEALFNIIIEEHVRFLRRTIVQLCPKDLGLQCNDIEQNAPCDSGARSKVREKFRTCRAPRQNSIHLYFQQLRSSFSQPLFSRSKFALSVE